MVLDETALTIWVENTFFIVPAQKADSLLSTFNGSPSATLHSLPQLSEVVVHCSYSPMDGRSTTSATSTVHSSGRASPVSFGTEFKNHSPGLFDAAGVQTDVTLEIQQTTTSLLTNLVSSQPSLGFPTISRIPYNRFQSGSTSYSPPRAEAWNI